MVTMVMRKVKKKMKKKVFLQRKNLGATALKLGMHIQLYSGSNIGRVPLGHTSSLSCVRLKMTKMVYQKNT